ncbi:MAG: 23S rRNA (pseudouridine(1915)-N(3))-methyltransferase RlmH [bacterium]
MRKLEIYYYGKIKNLAIKELVEYYTLLCNKTLKVELVCLKDPGERKITIHDLPKKAKLILLSEKGKEYSTLKFKEQLTKWIEQFSEVYFVIGNAYGFSEELLEQYQLLSLSQLTTAHELALVILLEQLFRVLDLARGGKYHK